MGYDYRESNTMKSILIHLEDARHKHLNRLKNKMGLTWLELIMKALKE